MVDINSILVNMTSNCIYDISKNLVNKKEDIKIEDIVVNFIKDFEDSEIDSGSFATFLNSYEVKNEFRNFIHYIEFTNEKTESNIIDESKFIEYMTTNAIKYVKNDINKDLNYDKVRLYFERLLKLIEENFELGMSEENKRLLYFMQRKLNRLENNILGKKQLSIIKSNETIENTYRKYIEIIKEKYSKDHVYGFKRLSLKDFYVKPKFEIVYGENQIDVETPYIRAVNKKGILWENIFNYSNIISIIGGAGFGKSLFLKNMASEFDKLQVLESSILMPIYCDLKLYTEYSDRKTRYSIEDFLIDCMINTSGMDSDEISKDFLRYFLNKGRCLILFDALDEVEFSKRNEIHEKIINFFKIIDYNNKVCLTSRETGFCQETSITYRVKKVDREAIEKYIENMSKLGKFEMEDRDIFLKQSSYLIEKGFLNSFLILSLLLNIFEAERELPENKVDLYETCIKYIAIRREESKELKFDFKLIRSILKNNSSFEKLSSLASPNNKNIYKDDILNKLTEMYKNRYIDQNKTSNAIEEFLRFCAERTELFVLANEHEEYKFYHRSFFEFYYANYLRKNIRENKDLINELFNFRMDSEIFELIIILLKKHDLSKYEELIEYVFEEIEKSSDEERTGRLFEILTVFLMVSDEEVYIDKLYDICFASDTILLLKNSLSGIVTIDRLLCIFRNYNYIDKFIARCEEKYIDYLLCAQADRFLYIKTYELRENHGVINRFVRRGKYSIFINMERFDPKIRKFVRNIDPRDYYNIHEYKEIILKNIEPNLIYNTKYKIEDKERKLLQDNMNNVLYECIEELYRKDKSISNNSLSYTK